MNTSIIVLLLGLGISACAQSVNYQWDNLKIGGGGYVTGMVVHPLDKNIKYIRTDVGGAYKWDADESK